MLQRANPAAAYAAATALSWGAKAETPEHLLLLAAALPRGRPESAAESAAVAAAVGRVGARAAAHAREAAQSVAHVAAIAHPEDARGLEKTYLRACERNESA